MRLQVVFSAEGFTALNTLKWPNAGVDRGVGYKVMSVHEELLAGLTLVQVLTGVELVVSFNVRLLTETFTAMFTFVGLMCPLGGDGHDTSGDWNIFGVVNANLNDRDVLRLEDGQWAFLLLDVLLSLEQAPLARVTMSLHF